MSSPGVVRRVKSAIYRHGREAHLVNLEHLLGEIIRAGGRRTGLATWRNRHTFHGLDGFVTTGRNTSDE